MPAHRTEKVSGALGLTSHQPLGHGLAMRQQRDGQLDPPAKGPAESTPAYPGGGGRGPHARTPAGIRPRGGTGVWHLPTGQEAIRAVEDSGPTLRPDRRVVASESLLGPTSPYNGTSGPAAVPLRPHLWPWKRTLPAQSRWYGLPSAPRQKRW